jgi:uncharacterized protein
MSSSFLNQSFPRIIIGLAAFAALVYVVILAGIWWKQEKLLFVPAVLKPLYNFNHPSDISEFWIDVPGAKLNALHLRVPKPKAIVFFLHGNAGNLDNWFVNMDFYRQMNVDVVMIDYRGYGKSTGQVDSEAQLVNDVALSWQLIAPQYPSIPAVFIGRSLGSGLAAKLNAQLTFDQKPKLTILVSPYFSLEAMAKLHFPWVPAFLVRYPMRTNEALTTNGNGGPVLLLHGDQDPLIPFENSQRLAKLSPNIKLIGITGAAHNDLQEFPAYLAAIREAIRQVTTAP